MSTNSFIAYKENNKITGIYCHWDGYLEYNGDMLKTLYPKKPCQSTRSIR